MSALVAIPKVLYDEVAKRGIDVEESVTSLLIEKLGLDPASQVRVRIELASRYLEEGRSLIDKDPAQASEKLYKAAEECVKALAAHLNVSEVLSRVEGRGRWTTTELEKAVEAISRELGSWFRASWDTAWVLYVWGFHEAKLDSEAVRMRLPDVERLVEETVRVIANRGRSREAGSSYGEL